MSANNPSDADMAETDSADMEPLSPPVHMSTPPLEHEVRAFTERKRAIAKLAKHGGADDHPGFGLTRGQRS